MQPKNLIGGLRQLPAQPARVSHAAPILIVMTSQEPAHERGDTTPQRMLRAVDAQALWDNTTIRCSGDPASPPSTPLRRAAFRTSIPGPLQ